MSQSTVNNEPVYFGATEADGRSLQARFDTPQFKRKTVSFVTQSQVPLVFMGYAPLAGSVEWISWDPKIRRYVPAISHGLELGNQAPLEITKIDPKTCISCHHTPSNDPLANRSVSLIFPAFPWFEQTNDPKEKNHILEASKQNSKLFRHSNLNQIAINNLTEFVMGPNSKKAVENKDFVTLTDAAEFDSHIRIAQRIQNNARICEQVCVNDENCLKKILAFIVLVNSNYSSDRESLVGLLNSV
ncbi:hypothetical protein K2X05_07390 [bacterium]|nr:hypothetical protein [bacterium]